MHRDQKTEEDVDTRNEKVGSVSSDILVQTRTTARMLS